MKSYQLHKHVNHTSFSIFLTTHTHTHTHYTPTHTGKPHSDLLSVRRRKAWCRQGGAGRVKWTGQVKSRTNAECTKGSGESEVDNAGKVTDKYWVYKGEWKLREAGKVARHQHRQRITHSKMGCTSLLTHGISSGRTSERMLMDSVLALDVGAAASSNFSSAICMHRNIATVQWNVLFNKHTPASTVVILSLHAYIIIHYCWNPASDNVLWQMNAEQIREELWRQKY